jgi:peptidoglycan/xylan/chitin deacetylase (PgdA/CDA1 family)
MSFRAILVGPPPLELSAIAMTAYFALVLGGVFVLRWRVFVDAVVRGPQGARGVALTFDDGPHPKWTPRVLATLAKHDAKATFFLVARKAEEHPDVVRAILDAGHAVGLHSYAHDRLFALRREGRVRGDLERGIAALEKLTGSRPTLFRPPIGHTNPVIARVVDKLDLTVVGWSAAGRDGVASANAEDVVSRVRRDLRDGAIVLLHDSPEKGNREPAAVKALPLILDALAAERLDVVPLESFMPPEN